MLIQINKHTERELFQTDHWDKIVPADKRTAFRAEIGLTCKASDNSIDLGLLVWGEVALERLAAVDKDKRLPTVAFAIAKQATTDLSKARSWELYRTEQIYVPGDALTEPENYAEFGAEVTPTNDLAASFQEATRRHDEISVAFERAKDFLTSHMYSIFHVRDQAYAAARFLAQCMQNDASPYMYSWNREKAHGLVRGIEELGNRRNPNHHGYTSTARILESTLYSLHPPDFWSDYPPSIQNLSF